jgi:hypothetical protein
MMKRTSTMVAIASLAGSAFAATAPAAQADPEAYADSKTVRVRTDYGAVYFYDYGDVLHVSDYAADGRGVRGYAIAKGKRHTVYTNRGLNSWDDKSLRLKEGTAVFVQLCYTKKGKDVKCSGLVKGYA